MDNSVRMYLGVELDLTAQELEGLVSGRCSPQQLLALVQSKRCKINGRSYFPQLTSNDGVTGLECELPETPMAKFLVETLDGTLAAYQIEDPNYPGIGVDLLQAVDEPNITLSLTEYIMGGEGISDFDLSNPDEMCRQQSEVPPQRRQMGDDGRETVTAGFVTRGWPNERADEERHHRIFHYGYKKETGSP